MKVMKFCSLLLAVVLAAGLIAPGAAAAEAPCESAVATGCYRHPVTGKIEDSGGESSEALGQSMVNSVVSGEALLETAADGQMYLSLRFNLMSNISKTDFRVQKPGDTDWTSVAVERTAEGEDSADLRLPVPGKDAIVRAECFVDAMGRAVVFYVQVDGFTSGNAGNFARMDENYVPSATAAPRNPETPSLPGSGPVSGGTAVSNGEVPGLVIGGSGTAPSGDPQQPAGESEVREVLISGRVWVMIFLVVFCAQILACLAFWGIQHLILGKKNPRRPMPKDSEEPQEEPDFSDEDWEKVWEETKDEVR